MVIWEENVAMTYIPRSILDEVNYLFIMVYQQVKYFVKTTKWEKDLFNY